jgi:probable rRNA maturation factor
VIYLPPWRVDVVVRPDVPRVIAMRELARVVAAALRAAGAPKPASIGLILANDGELARLNECVAGQLEPTDVLSFPLLPPSAFPAQGGRPTRVRAAKADRFQLPPGRRPHLGDIVISVGRAMAQAEGGAGGQTGNVRWSPADELRLLAVHGALHLCGWDHAEPGEERAMRALEQKLLRDRDASG